MAKTLSTGDSGFEAAFAAFLSEKREASADVGAAVAAIIEDVGSGATAALAELTQPFDRTDLASSGCG